MKNLYINTCGKDVIIKLFNKHKILREETVIGQKNNSQFIMPTIKKVLTEDLPDGIIVVIGPGSFTGVRLGVTIAKTFAYVNNIPIKTINSLEETAVSIRGKDKIVSIKENNGYFIGHFDKFNNSVEENFYLSNEDYLKYCKDNKVLNNIKINYSNVVKFVLKKNAVNPHSVKPIYVKVIEVLK